MTESESEPPVTWARRLRIFMLAVTALAFATTVIKVFQGEEPPLWWLYLIILAGLFALAWVESGWAVFAFVLYIAVYKFIPILDEDSQPLRKVVLILGVALVCGLKYLYDRRKARGA
ncbi:MAG: hypothetical protein K1X51_15415 [Rhodospirillaceae bacterium]|nr:hypothetical protein [Rhodospirillaceae bacterium]